MAHKRDLSTPLAETPPLRRDLPLSHKELRQARRVLRRSKRKTEKEKNLKSITHKP